MKKLLFSAIILATNFAFGQITLEHSFPNGEHIQSYSNGNEMFYVSYKEDDNKLKIYNADYSLRKTITVPIPANYTLWLGENYYEASPYSVSKHIFNTDDKYEFMVEGHYYDESTQTNYTKLLLINEDGQLIKDFHPNAGTVDFFDFYYIYHDSTVNKNKLIIENEINNTYESQFDIYSLPTSELTTKEIQSHGKLSAFPVPTDKILNITNPDNGANTLEIFDASGKLILNKIFQSNENRISVEVENLPKGNYIYKIGNQSAKFIKN